MTDRFVLKVVLCWRVRAPVCHILDAGKKFLPHDSMFIMYFLTRRHFLMQVRYSYNMIIYDRVVELILPRKCTLMKFVDETLEILARSIQQFLLHVPFSNRHREWLNFPFRFRYKQIFGLFAFPFKHVRAKEKWKRKKKEKGWKRKKAKGKRKKVAICPFLPLTFFSFSDYERSIFIKAFGSPSWSGIIHFWKSRTEKLGLRG